MRNSFLNKNNFTPKSYRTVAMSGLGLVILLAVVAILQHVSPGNNEDLLFYFSIIFAILHTIIFVMVYVKSKNKPGIAE